MLSGDSEVGGRERVYIIRARIRPSRHGADTVVRVYAACRVCEISSTLVIVWKITPLSDGNGVW